MEAQEYNFNFMTNIDIKSLVNNKVVEMDVNSITPYIKNPRKIGEEAVLNTANSIKAFGWRKPIEVDENNVIIAGHTRLLAAKYLELETVPVIVHTNLSEEQKKAYRVADNRTNEFATWDIALLKEEYEDIRRLDSDMYVGFEDDYFSNPVQDDDWSSDLEKRYDKIEEYNPNEVRMVKITVEVANIEVENAKNKIKEILSKELVNDFTVS